MIADTLQSIGIPCAYGHFTKPVAPPFIVYTGNGQTTFGADNTWHYTNNRYQVEFYFKQKSELKERRIEMILLRDGFNYEKSEDIFIEDEGLYVIYYYI